MFGVRVDEQWLYTVQGRFSLELYGVKMLFILLLFDVLICAL